MRNTLKYMFIALAALLVSSCDQSVDTAQETSMTYPDWSGQWTRVGSLNWEPEGYAIAGEPPLTPE